MKEKEALCGKTLISERVGGIEREGKEGGMETQSEGTRSVVSQTKCAM